MHHPIKKSFSALVILLALAFSSTAFASSYRTVDFTTVCLQSMLIFEGTVVSKETRPSPVDNSPFTYVTYEVNDVIKGIYGYTTIELGFAGGTINGMTLTVSDVIVPEIGDKGIYFVETLDREYIQPFYGWHQGHYRIVHGATCGNVVVPSLKVEEVGDSSKLTNSYMESRPSVIDFKATILERLR